MFSTKTFEGKVANIIPKYSSVGNQQSKRLVQYSSIDDPIHWMRRLRNEAPRVKSFTPLHGPERVIEGLVLTGLALRFQLTPEAVVLSAATLATFKQQLTNRIFSNKLLEHVDEVRDFHDMLYNENPTDVDVRIHNIKKSIDRISETYLRRAYMKYAAGSVATIGFTVATFKDASAFRSCELFFPTVYLLGSSISDMHNFAKGIRANITLDMLKSRLDKIRARNSDRSIVEAQSSDNAYISALTNDSVLAAAANIFPTEDDESVIEVTESPVGEVVHEEPEIQDGDISQPDEIPQPDAPGSMPFI